MQIGELVNCVSAFPGASSSGAFGCESGRIGIFDSESMRITYNYQQNGTVCALEADTDNIIYSANQHYVYRHDLRMNSSPTMVLASHNEISKISIKGSIIATVSGEKIVLNDSRTLSYHISPTNDEIQNETNLEKLKRLSGTSLTKETPNKHIPKPIACSFNQNDSSNVLYVAFDDSSFGSFDVSSENLSLYEIPPMFKRRKMPALGIVNFDNTIVVGYESGASIYKDGKFSEHSTFDQRGLFSHITSGRCFDDDYIIMVVDENVILPCSIKDGHTISSKSLHGDTIVSISSNLMMILVADNNEDGYIGTFMPEMFSHDFF